MLSQFTQGSHSFPLPIFRSMSPRRAVASGLRSFGFSLACFVLLLLVSCMASPLHAQDTTPQLQPKSSSSSVPEQTQATRRSLENRRLHTLL